MIDDSRRTILILGLSAVPGVGSTTVRKLLPFLGEDASRTALRDALRHLTSLRSNIRQSLEAALEPMAWIVYEDIGKRAEALARKLSVQLLAFDSPHYPAYLRLLDDAPAMLYARGTLAEDLRLAACVGTREPSKFGERATEQITGVLAGAGWVIVSGLAKGVDSIAHRAALAQSGRTTAILGNGLDSVYPAANRELAEEIVASGGLLLSEQPFGAEPSPRNLVARDRLQSGASVATLVFETSVDGGAMHTARFAVKQRRLLACPVPPQGYVDLPSCSGVNLLLTQGAYAIASREAYPALLDRLEQQLGQMQPSQRRML